MNLESEFLAFINKPIYSNRRMRKEFRVLTFQEALLYGSIDEIQEMLRQKYNVKLSAQKDWEHRCREIIDICLDKKINVNMPDNKYSALLHFTMENLYEDFESVFSRCKGFDINALVEFLPDWYMSLLHFAIQKERKNVVKVLLKFGAKVDVKDSISRTPLSYTIRYAQNDIAEILLNAGANVNAKDMFEKMPIDFAFYKNGSDICFNSNGRELYHSDLIKLLCNYGADLNFQNANGTLYLFSACQNGDFNDVQFLIKHGADLLSRDHNGDTAIHNAVEGNNYDLIDFLLRSGVNINARNLNNESCIHKLARTHYYDTYWSLMYEKNESYEFNSTFTATVMKRDANMIEFLIDNGAKVNTMNSHNITPLMESVYLNSLEVVESLLELKANVDIPRDSKYYLIDLMLFDRQSEFHVNADFNADRINAWLLLTAFLATRECDISEYCDANTTYFQWVRPFFKQCKTEVNDMKKRSICENRRATFFDFLTKDLMDVLKFCRNEEIMTVLESGKHKEEFPRYKFLFEKRMERVQHLQNCENTFWRFLVKYLKKKLPLVVVDKIINNLTAGNLRNFGRALSISKKFPNGNYYFTK